MDVCTKAVNIFIFTHIPHRNSERVNHRTEQINQEKTAENPQYINNKTQWECMTVDRAPTNLNFSLWSIGFVAHLLE